LTFSLGLSWSCSRAPTESEDLSSDTYGKRNSLRVTIFGVLTPGDSLQKIMIEDSRNNIMDVYRGKVYMSFSGWLAHGVTTYPLNPANVGIKDPFEMPDVYGVYLPIDDRMAQVLAEDIPDEDLIQDLLTLKVAIGLGITRSVRWLTTGAMAVAPGEVYRLKVTLMDSDFPDIETVVRDSTTVPGGFEITYPPDGSRVGPARSLKLSWRRSPGAAGYRVIAGTPLSSRKRFNVVIADSGSGEEQSFVVPAFFDEPAPYVVQVWALDANYFRFLSQRLEGRRVDRNLFFDYGRMNLSVLEVFGSRVMRKVRFTVE